MTLQRPSFTRTRVRAGYGRKQVDAAVGRVLHDLSATPRITVDEIDALAFHAGMYQAGYDMIEVDNWFDEAAEEAGGAPRPRTPPVATPQEIRRANLVGWVCIVLAALVLVYVYVL